MHNFRSKPAKVLRSTICNSSTLFSGTQQAKKFSSQKRPEVDMLFPITPYYVPAGWPSPEEPLKKSSAKEESPQKKSDSTDSHQDDMMFPITPYYVPAGWPSPQVQFSKKPNADQGNSEKAPKPHSDTQDDTATDSAVKTIKPMSPTH